jgi:hypothetical protein
MLFEMCRNLRSTGYEPYAPRDQRNSQPAKCADVFVQDKSRNQSKQNVSQGCRRQNVSKIRPRKRSRIGSEKSQQQKNA